VGGGIAELGIGGGSGVAEAFGRVASIKLITAATTIN
jgi:hypothetical protein